MSNERRCVCDAVVCVFYFVKISTSSATMKKKEENQREMDIKYASCRRCLFPAEKVTNAKKIGLK